MDRPLNNKAYRWVPGLAFSTPGKMSIVIMQWYTTLTFEQIQELGDIDLRATQTGRGWTIMEDWVEEHGGDREWTTLLRFHPEPRTHS